MDLDTKDRVLVAFYTEYQKDIPDNELITCENLGIEYDVFKRALIKLDNENLVNNIEFEYADDDIYYVGYDCAMISRYGINYVEQKLDISPQKPPVEKLKELLERSVQWGWEQAKDIIAKTIAEMTKAKINN